MDVPISYVDAPDVPSELTLDAYRRARARAHGQRRRLRMRLRLRRRSPGRAQGSTSLRRTA